jgi:hypothetical protein
MAAAQFFDFATFAAMVHRVGPHAELNPVVQTMAASGGLPAVALVKAALVILVGSTAVILVAQGNRRHRWMARAVLTVAIVAGMLGGVSNALTIWA